MFTLFQILMLIDGFYTWSLIGQGALALLAGSRRHGNLFYRVFVTVNRPVIAATRALTPRAVRDQYIGFVAVALLLALRVVIYMMWYANGWIPQGVGAR